MTQIKWGCKETENRWNISRSFSQKIAHLIFVLIMNSSVKHMSLVTKRYPSISFTYITLGTYITFLCGSSGQRYLEKI